MLSIVGDFLKGLPPLVKEILLLVIGVACLMASVKGGYMRDRMMGVIA
jgi:hypothetical protein